MKGFLLVLAAIGLTALGTASATAREKTQPTEPEFGSCRYYCGSHSYQTLAQCAAVCGGPANCDEIC